jgi:hypothetical protein
MILTNKKDSIYIIHNDFAKTKFVILSDEKYCIEGYYKSVSYVFKFISKMESV